MNETEELYELIAMRFNKATRDTLVKEREGKRTSDNRIDTTKLYGSREDAEGDPFASASGGREGEGFGEGDPRLTKGLTSEEAMEKLNPSEPDRDEGFGDDDPKLRRGLTADEARRMLDKQGVANSRTAAVNAKETQLEEIAGGQGERQKQLKTESVKIKSFFRGHLKTYARKIVGQPSDPENRNLTLAQYRSKVDNVERTIRRIKSNYLDAKVGTGSDLTSDLEAHYKAVELMQRVGNL